MNRLHPRVQVLWAVRTAVSASVLAALTWGAGQFIPEIPPWAPTAVAVVIFVIGVVLVLARYRVWRYEIRNDDIYLERGVFTRVRTVVPFVRIQHVDSARTPTERLVGLASTVVYTAGSRGADVRIPGLTPEGADELRERLKRLAIAESEDAV